MALAAREMDAWLREDPERVIVLHCKGSLSNKGILLFLNSRVEPHLFVIFVIVISFRIANLL